MCIVHASPSSANEKQYVKIATALCNQKNLSFLSDDAGPKFRIWFSYDILAEHLKFTMELEPLSKQSQTVSSLNEFALYCDAGEGVNKSSKMKRSIEHRK